MEHFSDEQIATVVESLKAGKPLPEYYQSFVKFPKKEYELLYADKAREVDILSDTMAVPLQEVKTFRNNISGKEWTNMLIFGNNLQVLKTLLQMKDEGNLKNSDGTSGVRLIYIDPPFGTGDEYTMTQGASAYSAKIKGAQFIEFLRKRLVFLREILAKDGSIYVRIDYHFGHYIKMILDEVFGGDNFQNEIVINRFKRQLRGLNQFNVATDSLFLYSKSGRAFFNEIYRKRICSFCSNEKDPEWHHMISSGLRNPPERTILGRRMLPPKGQHWKYKQEKIDQMIIEGRIRINDNSSYTDIEGNKVRGIPEFLQTEETPVDSNWSDIKGYQLGYRYPTENPEELLDRVILASSKPGDIVLDCFAGSGTTLAVAEKRERRWIGVDCGKLAIYVMQKRLLNISRSKSLDNSKKKYGRQCSAFTLYNAGLYDYGMIKQLPWDEYRSFALKLFQCRDEKHEISKIDMDGYLGADSVLVFNYQKHKGAVMDRGFIDDTHNYLGDKIGRRFFIIAPAASVRFLEDYIDIGKTRYFILRIPYSIIDEIHNQGFTKIKQPSSEMDVNNTIDAVGFDFIQVPTIECKYYMNSQNGQLELGSGLQQCVIKIDKFQSEVISRHFLKYNNLETLSMVMLDYNFNGEVFNLDQVYFANDLEKCEYKINFPATQLKTQMMIIYIDIFGNEKREVKIISDFLE